MQRNKSSESKQNDLSSNDEDGKSQIKSLNRRLRGIYERNGLEYGDDASNEDDIVDRFEKATDLSKSSIRDVMQKIKQAKMVDLCFLIDATASMQPHIDGVRDSIKKIVATLKNNKDKQLGIEVLRFAVVAYRDFDTSEQFEVLKFTNRKRICIDFCSKVRAHSGGDTPEDVFGGIDEAIRLNWDENAGSKILFHMCDAPCHGREFHENIRDSYPDGDPLKRKLPDLFKSIKDKGIDYYFGKITRHTDKMIEKFSAAYGKAITNFNVQEVTQIADSVIASISATVDFNIEASKRGVDRAKLRDYKIDDAQPNWAQIPVQVGKYIEFRLPSDKSEFTEESKCLRTKNTYNVRVKIAPKPFSEGSERIAFYGQDLFTGHHQSNYASRGGRGRGRGREATPASAKATASATAAKTEDSRPTEVVLKEFKFVGNKQNSLERYMSASEIQTVASFLANQFNELCGRSMQIKFLKTKTLIIESEDSGLRVMTCERKLKGLVEFIKFSNNVNYSIDKVTEKVKELGLDSEMLDVIAAFSHWTYHYTNGFLMVVDLQGCVCRDGQQNKVMMTDPAIHCLDITRYAPMNLGSEGMSAFLQSHQCNAICRHLRIPYARNR